MIHSRRTNGSGRAFTRGYSHDSRVETYPQYLSRRSHLDEQLRGQRDAAREIVDGVSSQTRDILGSMGDLSHELGAGLGALQSSVESGLGHLAGLLEGGFAAILRRQDQIAAVLTKLIQLAESPEHTKALENFRHAVYAMPRELWDEALEYLGAAIEGDAHSKGYKLDWHFHWMRAELLLGAPKRHDWPGVNPSAAEQAFLLAARYARADEPVEAAKALLLASASAFAQADKQPEKLADMLRHAEAAHTLDPRLAPALFQAAKARMALGEVEDALPALRKAIDLDAAFAIRAGEDPDCRRHELELNGFLDALRREALTKARAEAERVLAAQEAALARWPDLAAHEATVRLREVAAPGCAHGLVALLRYGRGGLGADAAALAAAVDKHVKADTAAAERHAREVKDARAQIAQGVRAARAAHDPLAQIWTEIGRPDAVVRWHALDSGQRTLTDAEALDYAARGLASDTKAVETFVADVLSNLRLEERVVTTKYTEPTDVEEPYEVKETYWEEVVIRPAGIFRKAVTESEQRTRTVRKVRTVRRPVERERSAKTWVLVSKHGSVVPAFNLRPVPAGRFRMGSPGDDPEGLGDERPQHEVVLTRPFRLADAPVTQRLWQALMGTAPFSFKGPDRPVESVSWFDAVAFCNALSRSASLEEAYVLTAVKGKPGDSDFQAEVRWKGLGCPGYRLPTEAEWEYACRASSTAPRYGELDRVAWYEGNSGKETHPVYGKLPNAWGLHDLLGNVWEWCWDRKGSYAAELATDPVGPATGSYRVLRGGSWDSSA